MNKNKKLLLTLLTTGAVLMGMGISVPAQTAGEALTEEALTKTAGEALTESAGREGFTQVASSADMADVEDVVEDWMVPIPAADVANGVYDVEVLSSSAMFPIVEGLLAVSDDSMSLKITMGGDGYLYVYPGTPEDAAAADPKDYVAFEEDDEGRQTYTIPVSALDEGFKCAAFSKRKEKWYDRTLLIPSYSMPADALPQKSMSTVESLELEDGTYSVDALLQGGSGRASITSPAALTVQDGQATLEVIFSSPHYDYMLVKGERYEPVNEEGNSTFLIPIDGFDYQMPVVADTTAMSKPHEINYTILLDSASIR